MTDYFDALEIRDPGEREAALCAALPAQIAAAQGTAAYAEILRGVDASAIGSRQALAQLPVTRKHELLERQKAQRGSDPFGGFSAIGWRGAGCGAAGAPRVPVARPDLRTRRPCRRLLALRPRAVCRRLPRRRSGAQQLQLPPHPGRLDDGNRRGRPSAARSSRAAWATPSCNCRRWWNCAPMPMSARPASCASRSRRPTRWGWRCPRCARPRSAARPFLRRCAMRCWHAASRPTRATAPPTWA